MGKYAIKYQKSLDNVSKKDKILKQTKEWREYDRARIKAENLLENCVHEDIIERSRYNSGSYYDWASTDYWVECDLCKKVLKRWTERYSYYG